MPPHMRVSSSHQQLALALAISICFSASLSAAARLAESPPQAPLVPDKYHSLIRAFGNHRALHVVGDGMCIHAAGIDVSSHTESSIMWSKAPLGLESELDMGDELVWGSAHSAVYTHRKEAKVAALDINNGSLRWSWPVSVWWPWRLIHREGFQLPWGVTLHEPTPTVDNLLLLRSQNPETHVFAVDAKGPGRGELVWSFDSTDGFMVADLKVDEHIVYIALSRGGAAPPPSEDPLHVGTLTQGQRHQQVMVHVPAGSNSNVVGGGEGLSSVVALNVSNGEVLWIHSAGLPWETAYLMLAPTVLLFAGQPGEAGGGMPLIGLGLDSGTALWQRECSEEQTKQGGCAVEVVDTKRALIVAKPFRFNLLQAFDLLTGEDLWSGADLRIPAAALSHSNKTPHKPDATATATTAAPAPAAAAPAAAAPAAAAGHSKTSATLGNELSGSKITLMDDLSETSIQPGDELSYTHNSISHGKCSAHSIPGYNLFIMCQCGARELNHMSSLAGTRSSGQLHDIADVIGGRGKRKKLCAYSLDVVKGKLSWVVDLQLPIHPLGNVSEAPSLPEGAAEYGLGPLATADFLLLPVAEGVLALEPSNGAWQWGWKLPTGHHIHGWEALMMNDAVLILRSSAEPGQGSAEDGVAEDRVAEDRIAEEGVAEDGVAEDGVAEDGAAEDGVAEDVADPMGTVPSDQHMYALAPATGTLIWKFVAPNSSDRPSTLHPFPLERGQGILLLDGCFNGRCCLWGVEARDGAMHFSHCFDAKKMCGKAIQRRWNDHIIGLLLGVQVIVMSLGMLWSFLYYICVPRRMQQETYEPMVIHNSTDPHYDSSDC